MAGRPFGTDDKNPFRTEGGVDPFTTFVQNGMRPTVSSSDISPNGPPAGGLSNMPRNWFGPPGTEGSSGTGAGGGIGPLLQMLKGGTPQAPQFNSRSFQKPALAPAKLGGNVLQLLQQFLGNQGGGTGQQPSGGGGTAPLAQILPLLLMMQGKG